MFSHICLGTNNLSESIKFYDQVMSALNIRREETEETYACYGDKKDVGSGVNYSMNEITAMFDNYPTKYIPARKGEYDTTLCVDTRIKDILGWNPQDRIEKYIKEEIGV